MSQQTLEEVIGDSREDIAIRRKMGYLRDAELLEQLLDRVARAAEDFTTWLSEKDSELRSGRPVRWLRANFAQWADDGNARLFEGRRYYRQLIIPRRGNPSAAREAGRQAGRKTA